MRQRGLGEEVALDEARKDLPRPRHPTLNRFCTVLFVTRPYSCTCAIKRRPISSRIEPTPQTAKAAFPAYRFRDAGAERAGRGDHHDLARLFHDDRAGQAVVAVDQGLADRSRTVSSGKSST